MQVVVRYLSNGGMQELAAAVEEADFLKSQLREAMAALAVIEDHEGEFEPSERARLALSDLRLAQEAAGIEVEGSDPITIEYLDEKYGRPPV
jgi:hypothetical protein